LMFCRLGRTRGAGYEIQLNIRCERASLKAKFAAENLQIYSPIGEIRINFIACGG